MHGACFVKLRVRKNNLIDIKSGAANNNHNSHELARCVIDENTDNLQINTDQRARDDTGRPYNLAKLC